MMNEEWFLFANGDKSGPMGLADLKAKLQQVDRSGGEILVWSASTVEWVDPSKVPGLMDGTTEAAGPALQLPVTQPASTTPSASLNPYAAPQTSAANAPILGTGNHPLEVGGSISVAWQRCVDNMGVVVLTTLTFLAIIIVASIPSQVLTPMRTSPDGTPDFNTDNIVLFSVFYVIQLLVTTFLGLGFTLFSLKVVQGRNPSVGDLFAGGPYMIKAILAYIVLYLGMFATGIPVIIAVVAGGDEPGALFAIAILVWVIALVILGARFYWFQFALIDQKAGPIQCFRISWQISRGNTLSAIGVLIVGSLIYLAGFIALCIGVLWTLPVFFAILAAAYHIMAHGRQSLSA